MDAKVIQFDLEHLRMITGDDGEFMIEIMGMIQAESPDVMKDLKSHFSNGEFETLAKAAHKYKSSINILGNAEMAGLLKNLELTAADNPENTTAIEEMLGQLEQHVSNMLAWIKETTAELEAAG